MHDDAISAEQRVALSALRPAAERGFYLAGATGVCLRLAHRRSVDLDFCFASTTSSPTLSFASSNLRA